MATPAPPGSAAVHGRRWGARAETWAELQEVQQRPKYAAVFDRLELAAGSELCDVGCASGVAAQVATQRGAKVSGIDAAENLIAIARRRVPTADFRVGEMEELPFADDSFDCVTSFSAFDYATRPTVALAEARRVAKPGGRIMMMTWDQPEGMGMASLINALNPLLPPLPIGRPGNFALADERNFRALVESAGLVPLWFDHLEMAWEYPDLATALRGLASSGRAVRAIELTSEDAVNAANRAALAPFRSEDGRYRIDSRFIWTVALA